MSLLEVKDLAIHYFTAEGTVCAVNGISFQIDKGQTLGLVGETGAGKTTAALGILQLVPDPPGRIIGGSVYFDGRELTSLSKREMRRVRGEEISMIFQDPMTALNPVLTIQDQIAEMIRAHSKCSRAQAMVKALEMLKKVGIPANRGAEYPHQFSGGMKQRVVIAIALACTPSLLIADEPTTALDVTIQAQVLEMMNELKKEIGTSLLLITHDLGVVADCCDSVAIMYAGEIVEYGSLDQIFNHTAHPYTQGLFDSIPSLDEDVDRLKPIAGMMPDPTNLPVGCKFSPRCPYADEHCRQCSPQMTVNADGHQCRCFYPLRREGFENV